MKKNNDIIVNVIGAGLAGCEASYQIAKRGIKVKLYEMKPSHFSPAHTSKDYAELVCSNSLRSNRLTNAVGLLKEELRLLDSLLIKTADECQVPAGGALAVDRNVFSSKITNIIKNHPLIEAVNEKVEKFDLSNYTIVASGPLTSEGLFDYIEKIIGHEKIHFYDAISPIVSKSSIDFSRAFIGNRYEEDGQDYINCEMTRQEYEDFYNELINAEKAPLKDFEKSIEYFEGCMPIEKIASTGIKGPLFGPMKPVGLKNPKGERFHAIVQLRKESINDDLYNIVGFQTNLKYSEQKRVFSMIPALKKADFVRYGSMHRNSFINSPDILNKSYQMKKHPNIFFAGQISGVEGYTESISSGLYAGINMVNFINGKEFIDFPETTAIGGLSNYITASSSKNFQPTNSNFGIIKSEEINQKLNKQEKRKIISKKSLEIIKNIIITSTDKGIY